MQFEGFNGGEVREAKKAGSAQKVAFPEFTNADGSAFEAVLIPGSTPEGEREVRRWRLKYSSVQGDHFDLDDAALDELAERDQKAGPELGARLIKSWNLKGKDGKPVKDDMDTKIAFLTAFPSVHAAIMAKLTELAKQLEKPKAS